MPNWSDVEITFHSENKELLSQIYNGIRKYGYGFDEEFRLPKELNENIQVLKDGETKKDYENFITKSDCKFITQNEQQELIKKYGTGNWYDWCRENWGTKWNMLEPASDGDDYTGSIEFDDNSIDIYFQSPWCGPYLWFEKVCKKYKLSGTIIHYEEGCDFYEELEYENGKFIRRYQNEFICPQTLEIYGFEYFIENTGFETFIEFKDDEEIYHTLISLDVSEKEMKSYFEKQS